MSDPTIDELARTIAKANGVTWDGHSVFYEGVGEDDDGPTDQYFRAAKAVSDLITSARSVGGDVVELREALRPFAEFVTPDPKWMADADVVTMGSPLARKQLTAGQCRAARAALSRIESGGGALPAAAQPSVPTEQADRAVLTNQVGAAEAEVGRAVYERIECLFGAAPNTPEAAELAYLAELAETVEEYGSYDGPTVPLVQHGERVAWRYDVLNTIVGTSGWRLSETLPNAKAGERIREVQALGVIASPQDDRMGGAK